MFQSVNSITNKKFSMEAYKHGWNRYYCINCCKTGYYNPQFKIIKCASCKGENLIVIK